MVTMSLLALFQYNEELFSGLELPAAIDKGVFVNNLLAECAELEILYTDPDFLQFMISEWSKKEFPLWEKLERTTRFEYDPISNYDRTEEWEDVSAFHGKSSAISGDNNSSVNTRNVAGFNSGELVKSEENKTSVENSTSSEENSETSGNTSRRGRAYGNIGVTTTQQMIDEERRVVKFNIVDYIIDSFKQRFCLLIY